MAINQKSLNQFIKFLKERELSFRIRAPLSQSTTFRLGGECPCLVFCEKPVEVIDVITELAKKNLAFFLMGDGSNLLVSDQGISKVVICYSSNSKIIALQKNKITVSGSTILDSFVQFTVDQGINGFVNCSGIPGTVGGAIAGNAGAFGWEIATPLISLKVIDSFGRVNQLNPEHCGFVYRNSRIRDQGYVILEATFSFNNGFPNDLISRRTQILATRKQKHPNIPIDACAGSFFKNTEPTSAAERRQASGWFLEKAGAKKMKVGGAGVFEKHANIIVQEEAECTAQDVLDLSYCMSEAVRKKFGIMLEREVQVLGEFTFPCQNSCHDHRKKKTKG